MKKENDEITDLFRSRLGNAEMTGGTVSGKN